jgi:hypothetical protein
LIWHLELQMLEISLLIGRALGHFAINLSSESV